jgi:outer membrane autotransporter protein
LSPSLEVTSYSETQQAFTSKAGVAIPEQTASLGRLTAGQEFGYRFVMPDRSLLEPYVGLKALWDFQKDTTVSIGGMDIGTTTLRGKLEAGMRYSTPSGISIVGAVGHDGIGDRNYKAYDGRVQVNIPFR